MRLRLIALCALAAGAIAASASHLEKRSVVHEKRHKLPHHWQRHARPHPASIIVLSIALTQRNLDEAYEFLMDVSHPASPNFGQHWSPKKVAETFSPSKETVNVVSAWFREAGITEFYQSQSLNWIRANVTIKKAEQLLRTNYFNFEHANGKSHIACDEYSVPESVQKHVDFITPTVHFDVKVYQQADNGPGMQKREATQPHLTNNIGNPGSNVAQPKSGCILPLGEEEFQFSQCDKYITPICLRALYELPLEAPAHPQSKLQFFSNYKLGLINSDSYGVVEYAPQTYLQSDLDMFFTNFSSQLVGKSPILNSVDGGLPQTQTQSFNYTGESDLDLEYAMALAYPQEVTLYQIGDMIEGASFNNFLDALDAEYCTLDGGDDPTQDAIYPDELGGYKGPKNCGGFAASKVISSSYGYNEADLTPRYERRQCGEYLKLGLQGVTFLFSSGDSGVAGIGGQCIDSASRNYTLPDAAHGKFNPSFPGTCPYITSVGATQIIPGQTTTQHEKAAESVISSGGGFSNLFPLPDYQSIAVSSYFTDHNPPYGADRYNNSQKTRGYPDLSANGVNYVAAVDGKFHKVSGTSASCPTVGAILTAVNALRLTFGKGPIGFINPTLYEHPEMLNDITSGGNQGCGTSGFQAVEGWDPVTGLGTPDFLKMAVTWLGLP